MSVQVPPEVAGTGFVRRAMMETIASFNRIIIRSCENRAQKRSFSGETLSRSLHIASEVGRRVKHSAS
jgi:hypothetical protein